MNKFKPGDKARVIKGGYFKIGDTVSVTHAAGEHNLVKNDAGYRRLMYSSDLELIEPAQGEETPWISVEDGLPPLDEKVFVYGIPRGQNPQMGNPYKVTQAMRQDLSKSSIPKRELEKLQDKNQFSYMSDVTHWRRIAPPTSKEKNQ